MDEDEQYQQTNYQQMYNNEGSLKYQIEATDIIEDIMKSLRAQLPVLNSKTGRVEYHTPSNVEPIINEKGINSIMTSLRSRLTKIFILSDLDQETISFMTIQLGKNLIEDLYHNWQEYEVKDSAAASLIVSIICDTTYATLRKGYKGNYLKFLRTTHSIQEVQHNNTRGNVPTGMNSTNEATGMWQKLFGKRR